MRLIYTRHIHQFSMELLEGKIYIFNDFEVWRVGECYKNLDHSFLIRLSGNSTITLVSEERVLINCKKIRFRDYDQLMKIANNHLSYDGN